jgi:hypothetical protein
LDEYESDEFVLDRSTPLPETTSDSRWGSDNDVGRVAVTWDDGFLYIGIECVTLDSELMVLLDHTGGGIADMRSLGELRRNVTFYAFAPDLWLRAHPQSERVEGLRLPHGHIDQGAFGSRFTQETFAGGALEVAIPWDLVEPADGVVSLLAAITGDVGTGAGDAAPDPSAILGTARGARADLDRVVRLEVDADGDGSPDAGVSPRVMATVSGTKPAVDDLSLAIDLDVRSFAPDEGESVAFTLRLEGGGEGAVFASAQVFSVSGELVRVLFRDERQVFGRFLSPTSAAWDGRDDSGNVVAGGVYLINVTWGVARGTRTGGATVSVAVAR